MDTILNGLTSVNDVLWTYILVVVLLGCGIWFTIKTKFVQFTMLGEMVRLLGDNKKAKNEETGKKHISSLEAFFVSIATRIGTGNLAGVATAIAVGGPGAVFWMWVVALLGSCSAFIESTLAQLYKEKSEDSFVGGPAYYIKKGLKSPKMALLFAVLLIFTFPLAFNSVQSNTICEAFSSAFGTDGLIIGIILTICTLVIIFGGISRIAKISSIIVPIMAIGYLFIALFVIILNIENIPYIFKLIVSNAFGFEQALGGGIGMAMIQGIKRGLFSNEAGMGSAPNVAATANVSHPVKQGLVQALGVFTDTLIVCTCTAFIILCSGVYQSGNLNGIQLTQSALNTHIGDIGTSFVAIAILFFAFSSVLGNYYYGEANLRLITSNKTIMFIFRLSTAAMVMFGALVSLDVAWALADVFMGLMTLCNIVAICYLGKYAIRLLEDYRRQRREGVKSPIFKKESLPDIADDIECWD